jgi:hypothetical protein
MDAFLESLAGKIGREAPQDQAAYDLKFALRDLKAPGFGVHHVTCSDEAERESIEVFQRCLVQDLAPRLKLGNLSAFRTATLGGRYEWGSLAIAESNFSGVARQSDFKVMLVKINAHVGLTEEHNARRYGLIERYGRSSAACGALHALLHGTPGRFADQLREQFSSEGMDRVERVLALPSAYRYVAAAVVSARLQARSAAMDAQDHKAAGPTMYVIVPAVTLNRSQKNSEVLCGAYMIDRRDKPRDLYIGVGDDPSTYEFTHEHSRLRVHDEGAYESRTARDHRQ